MLQLATDDPAAAYMLLLQQLSKTVEAIASAHRAAGDLTRARAVETMSEVQLHSVHARLRETQPAGLSVATTERPLTLSAREQRVAYAAEIDARTDISEEIKQVLKARHADTVGQNGARRDRPVESPPATPTRPARVDRDNDVER